MRDRKGSSRPGVAFNRKLRAQIVTHAQTRISAGERVADVAERLGIKCDTLRYWLERLGAKRENKMSRFRPVHVVDAELTRSAKSTLTEEV